MEEHIDYQRQWMEKARAEYQKRNIDEPDLEERKLTSAELKKREEYAKDLPDDEFKERYGKDWMSVKMATATKMAKK